MSQIATDKPELSRRESAMQWARAYLTDHGGEACAQELYRAGAAAGYRTSTLQAARKASTDVITVKEGRGWVWKLVSAQELTAVAKAHSTDLDALEERQRDRTRPFRTVVTNWPCRGVSRVVTDTLDESAPGGYVRRTSWVHSQPTTCKAPTPTGETR
jgi:hypothetical protein